MQGKKEWWGERRRSNKRQEDIEGRRETWKERREGEESFRKRGKERGRNAERETHTQEGKGGRRVMRK